MSPISWCRPEARHRPRADGIVDRRLSPRNRAAPRGPPAPGVDASASRSDSAWAGPPPSVADEPVEEGARGRHAAIGHEQPGTSENRETAEDLAAAGRRQQEIAGPAELDETVARLCYPGNKGRAEYSAQPATTGVPGRARSKRRPLRDLADHLVAVARTGGSSSRPTPPSATQVVGEVAGPDRRTPTQRPVALQLGRSGQPTDDEVIGAAQWRAAPALRARAGAASAACWRRAAG